MSKIYSFYLKDDNSALIKPLGVNGEVYNFNVHFIPKTESFSGGIVRCLDNNCLFCKLITTLDNTPYDNNSLFNIVKKKFNENNLHFNIRKNKIFILPLYTFFKNKWYLNYWRMFSNEFVNLFDFIEKNNLYDIGNLKNSDVIKVYKKNNEINFIDIINDKFIINPLDSKNDYKKFIKFISNLDNFKIIDDINMISIVFKQFSLFIKFVVKNLNK